MASTRRIVLQVVASGFAAGLAGCSGEGSSTDEPQGELVTDYEQVTASAVGEQRLFRWTGEEARSQENLLLRTPDDRANVEIVSESRTVHSFVDETDLAQSSLVLFQRSLNTCRRLDAYKVSKRPKEVRVYLCQEPRPADVNCRTDKKGTAAVALRLPFDGDSVGGLTTSISSQCEDRFGPHRTKATEGGTGQ